MSAEAVSWAFGARGIRPREKLALIWLANNEMGEWKCLFDLGDLATVCCCKPVKAVAIIEALEAAGLIRVSVGGALADRMTAALRPGGWRP